MRKPLSEVDGRSFDVIVVGGGISGAASAQHLAADGYSVLLVEKDDFASAATSRSGRLLHCGLRYLAPTYSIWEFVRNPRQFATALGAARRSIRCSSDFIATTPELARPMQLIFAIDCDMPYSGWQVRLGAKLLELLSLGRQRLHCRVLSPVAAETSLPFVRWLRDKSRLASVVTFRDHQFYWPERICIDCVLDCERMGGVVRNYTEATTLARQPDGRWKVSLRDGFDGGAASATAAVVLNMAGPWIDRVNATVEAGKDVPRKVVGVKGVHILVRLSDECRGFGIMGSNRHNEAITAMPWGDLHYLGPTETLYEGDLDDVRPEDEDIDFILAEANHFMPGIALTRASVLQAWAGVRPINYDPALPKGRRMPFSVFQDLGKDGLENVLTTTWAAIMFHRSAAREVLAAVGARLKPSGPRHIPDFSARGFPDNRNSAAVVAHNPQVKMADLRHAAEREHAAGLIDLMFRRTSLGWTGSIPPELVEAAADHVARAMGWDADRRAQEVDRFKHYYEAYHRQDGTVEWSGGTGSAEPVDAVRAG